MELPEVGSALRTAYILNPHPFANSAKAWATHQMHCI